MVFARNKYRPSMAACSLLRMCYYSVVNCPGDEKRTLETRSLKNLKPRSFNSCAHRNITQYLATTFGE